jgi:hypothetical protein
MAFFAITDYSSMLNRIGWATFGAWLVAITALNQLFEPVHRQLSQLAVKVPHIELQVPAGVLLAAGGLAVLCRAIKFHDRLSDLFGIRSRFDVEEILLPLAAAAGVSLSLNQQAEVEKKRRELMGKVFYSYASSTPDKSVIDRHNVTMALDQWSWYWIVLEAAAVAFATAVFAACLGGFALGFWLVLGILASVWLLQYLRSRSVRYARDQLKQILEDDTRKEAIARVFRALPD